MFKFIKIDEDLKKKLTYNVSNSFITWVDLTEEFYYFLRGCGYELTHKEIIDYLEELTYEVTDDEKINSD